MRVRNDYVCDSCGFMTECLSSDDFIDCPICDGQMKRQFPTTAAVHIPSSFSTKTRKE